MARSDAGQPHDVQIDDTVLNYLGPRTIVLAEGLRYRSQLSINTRPALVGNKVATISSIAREAKLRRIQGASEDSISEPWISRVQGCLSVCGLHGEPPWKKDSLPHLNSADKAATLLSNPAATLTVADQGSCQLTIARMTFKQAAACPF